MKTEDVRHLCLWVLDVPTAQIQAIYKNALVALGKDVDHAR
jgi:hypothetical protein